MAQTVGLPDERCATSRHQQEAVWGDRAGFAQSTPSIVFGVPLLHIMGGTIVCVVDSKLPH